MLENKASNWCWRHLGIPGAPDFPQSHFKSRFGILVLLAIALVCPNLCSCSLPSPSWERDFQQIIDTGHGDAYILYDINEDGTPELIYDNQIFFYDSNGNLQSFPEVHYDLSTKSTYPVAIENGIMCITRGSHFLEVHTYIMKDGAFEKQCSLYAVRDFENPAFQWFRLLDNEWVTITVAESQKIQSSLGTDRLKFAAVDVPVHELAFQLSAIA